MRTINFGFKELKELNFWKAVGGEILVSILYIITVLSCGLSTQPVSHLHIALTVAFTVAVLASAFWDISGGHFNPAVSFALLLLGKISIARFIFYVFAQCAGSIAGSALLYHYTPPLFRGSLGALSLHKDIEPGVGFVIELTLTFQFIWTVVASTDSDVKQFHGFQPPLAIGLSVGIGLLAGFNVRSASGISSQEHQKAIIPYTGAALNPIRALGPAIIMDKREDLWVYWLGPLIGAMLASLSYQHVFRIIPRRSTGGSDQNQNKMETYQLGDQNA